MFAPNFVRANATGGTAQTLRGAGLEVLEIRKVSEDRQIPSVVDLIRRDQPPLMPANGLACWACPAGAWT